MQFFFSSIESLHEKDQQLKQTNSTPHTREYCLDVFCIECLTGAVEEKTRHVRHLESDIEQARPSGHRMIYVFCSSVDHRERKTDQSSTA